jgi:hypothetical protein
LLAEVKRIGVAGGGRTPIGGVLTGGRMMGAAACESSDERFKWACKHFAEDRFAGEGGQP